jgi:hypothetical protein
MTSSRSTASTSRLCLWAIAALVVLVCAPRVADAGGRKRVVVLEFEGEKAEKFHDAVVKLIKKTHTVIATDKWNGTAEEMSAATVNDKNIRKVAKKLKVDGVVEGKVEKRRDEYIIKIKLRSGSSGEYVGNPVNTKADSTKLDGDAQKDLKDELVGAINDLEENREGGGGDEEKPSKKTKKDDDEEKPSKKMKKDDDEEKPAKKTKKDDDEEKPAKKTKKDDDEEKPAKKFSKKDDEKRGSEAVGKNDSKKSKKDDDEEKPSKKKADSDVALKSDMRSDKKGDKKKIDEDDGDKKSSKKKEVAKKDDDESVEGDVDTGTKLSGAAALSPAQRAVDGVIGLSFNARRLSFSADGDLGPPAAGKGSPPGYRGTPVAGALVDLTLYPLAFGHKNKAITKDIGVNAYFDRVLVINSKDPQSGMTLATAMQRYAFGASFRYPLNKSESAPVIGGMFRYGRQNFTIAHTAPNTPDIPNVNYTSIEPSAFLKYPMSPKLTINVSAGFMIITNSGQIQNTDQYGSSSAKGFEGELGADYMLGRALFLRASLKAETIGFSFDGSGALTTNRDGDTAQDVSGARDTYLGGAITVGYLY